MSVGNTERYKAVNIMEAIMRAVVECETALAAYRNDTARQQEETANESWQRECADLEKGANILDDSAIEDYEDAREKVQDEVGEPLSIEDMRALHITLTTGGPARGYTLFIDSDGEPSSGYYWYQDWFTNKRIFWLDSQELARVVQVYDIYTGN